MRLRHSSRDLGLAGLALILGVFLAQPALAQTAPPPPDPSSQAPQVPPNLQRIREGVSRPPQLIVDGDRLRIYVEVIGKWPRFDELVKGYDLRNGPTPRGAVMTHSEFLAMVTPRHMYGSGGIRPTEMLQIAITNWAGKALVMKGLEAIRNARSEREIDEIRARIDRELAALRGR